VRVNTLRVCAFVEQPTVQFANLQLNGRFIAPPPSLGERQCHFVGHALAIPTTLYDDRALEQGTRIEGPAIVTTRATTYLVEPGWTFRAAAQGAVWFVRE
jgi:N-methylhydantoinase A